MNSLYSVGRKWAQQAQIYSRHYFNRVPEFDMCIYIAVSHCSPLTSSMSLGLNDLAYTP